MGEFASAGLDLYPRFPHKKDFVSKSDAASVNVVAPRSGLLSRSSPDPLWLRQGGWHAVRIKSIYLQTTSRRLIGMKMRSPSLKILKHSRKNLRMRCSGRI